MDPVTIIVSALAMGAAAGLKPTAEQAVKDVYSGLKKLIRDRYTAAEPAVDLLESDPEQAAFKEAAKQALAKAAADTDEEILRQTQRVVETVEQYAPETAAAINVKLADVKAAANFRIAELSASGDDARVDVDVQRAEAGEDFEIRSLHAGRSQGTDSKKEDGQ